MTFDQFEEWAKRMQERHEALAQSLEALTYDVHELQTGIGDLKAIAEASLRNINALATVAEDQQENIQALTENINALTENIQALAKTSENHERRITRLEDGE